MKDQLDVGPFSRQANRGLVSPPLQRSIRFFQPLKPALSSALTHIRLSCSGRGNTGFPRSAKTSMLG